MATLTETQKVKILSYLGYAQDNAVGTNSVTLQVLRDFLNRTFSNEFIAEITSVLTDLASVDSQLNKLLTGGDIEQADVVKFNTTSGIKIANNRGSQLVRKLASLCGVPVVYNQYTSNCYTSTYFVGY